MLCSWERELISKASPFQPPLSPSIYANPLGFLWERKLISKASPFQPPLSPSIYGNPLGFLWERESILKALTQGRCVYCLSRFSLSSAGGVDELELGDEVGSFWLVASFDFFNPLNLLRLSSNRS